MNGRVYDYKLARFLSVDTVISSPTNSQSINPYSYIGNNPLSGVDPTGYECNDYSFSRCDTIHYNSEERQRNPLKSTIEKFLKQWERLQLHGLRTQLPPKRTRLTKLQRRMSQRVAMSRYGSKRTIRPC